MTEGGGSCEFWPIGLRTNFYWAFIWIEVGFFFMFCGWLFEKTTWVWGLFPDWIEIDGVEDILFDSCLRVFGGYSIIF